MLRTILYNIIKNQFHGGWRLTFSWGAREYACMYIMYLCILHIHPPRFLNEKIIDGFYSRTRTIKMDCILKCAYWDRVFLKFSVCIIHIFLFQIILPVSRVEGNRPENLMQLKIVWGVKTACNICNGDVLIRRVISFG